MFYNTMVDLELYIYTFTHEPIYMRIFAFRGSVSKGFSLKRKLKIF